MGRETGARAWTDGQTDGRTESDRQMDGLINMNRETKWDMLKYHVSTGKLRNSAFNLPWKVTGGHRQRALVVKGT